MSLLEIIDDNIFFVINQNNITICKINDIFSKDKKIECNVKTEKEWKV